MDYKDTIKLADKGSVRIIAHRGLSGLERENTCSAFVAAANRSYYGIETDLRKTRDGYFVLSHDNNTERNCGDALIIENSAFRTLRCLQYKDRDGSFNRGDLIMPTLQEYVGICRRYKKACILELKGSYDEADLKEILAVVDSYGKEEPITYISFQLSNLLTIRRLRPEADVQYLLYQVTPEDVETIINNRLGLDCCYPALTEEIVQKLHAEDLRVNCWTVDDPRDAQRLIQMGVDEITSNILE